MAAITSPAMSPRWSTATSAPRDRHRATRSGPPAVVSTRAPSATATWIATVPTPPDPPCTSTVSPGRTWAAENVDHTVAAASGSAAAVTGSSAGIGSTSPARATARSAQPPPSSRATTSSPRRGHPTFAPTSTTRPDTSRPGQSGAPGGGG